MNRLVKAWDSFRTGAWEDRLVESLVDHEPAYGAEQLRTWLSDDDVIELLIKGTQESLTEARERLVHTIRGSASVAPQDAVAAADSVILAATTYVLSVAGDPTTRIVAMLLRHAVRIDSKSNELVELSRALARGQELQQSDLSHLIQLAAARENRAPTRTDILFAEDKPWHFSAIQDRLVAAGLGVESRHTSRAALDFLRVHNVAVVVVDLVLPEVGVEDLLSEPEVLESLFATPIEELGGVSLLRSLPTVSPRTTPIVWTSNSGLLPVDQNTVEVFEKTDDHRQFFERLLEILGDRARA